VRSRERPPRPAVGGFFFVVGVPSLFLSSRRTLPASMRCAQRASQMTSMNHMPTKLMAYICANRGKGWWERGRASTRE
jgi:hypothetical protein